MNAIQMEKMMEVVNLTSIMASPIEVWRDQWTRNGKLQLLSHPHTNATFLVNKTVRTMRDTERTLRMDLWNKCQHHFSRITMNSFRETFDALMNQAYSGVREDLIYYAQERNQNN